MSAVDRTLDIAMPVYNGERFLEEALRSILKQDYTDFRLLISDNASTDRTEEICRSFDADDSRIDYVRQPTNIGAAPNFNFLFDRSNAEYFKWAAADDLMAADFVSKCLAPLLADDQVVLGFSRVQVIDPDGVVLSVDDPAARLDVNNRIDRFGNLVRWHLWPCYEIFGIFRSSALENTALIAPFSGGDRNLLAHVALRGTCVIVPEELFQQRRHGEQSTRTVSNKVEYDTWFDPSNRGKMRLPELNRYINFAKVAMQEPIGVAEKARCLGHIGRQMAVRWRHIGSDVKRLHLR